MGNRLGETQRLPGSSRVADENQLSPPAERELRDAGPARRHGQVLLNPCFCVFRQLEGSLAVWMLDSHGP